MKRQVWLVLAIFVACGGKAVLDGPGEDGAGGASTSPAGPGAGTTVGTTTDVATTSTQMRDLCTEACAAISQCSTIAELECVGACQARQSCAAPRDAFLECYLDGTNPDLCPMPDECVDELFDMLVCDGRIANQISCGGMGNSCGCDAQDASGQTYSTFCDQFGNTSQCSCFRNGMEVGKCVHDGDSFDACEIEFGCCAGLLYIP